MSSEILSYPEVHVSSSQKMQQVQMPVRHYPIQRTTPYQRPVIYANKENQPTGRVQQNQRVHMQQTMQQNRVYEQQQQARRKLLMAPQSAPMAAAPSYHQQRPNLPRPQQVHEANHRIQGFPVQIVQTSNGQMAQRRISPAQLLLQQRKGIQAGGPVRRKSGGQKKKPQHMMPQPEAQHNFQSVQVAPEPVPALVTVDTETPSKLPDIVRQFGMYQIRVIRAVDEDMRIYPTN